MSWHIILTFVSIGLFIAVARYIDHPYMDEFFHVRQTLQYTNAYDFTTWDPKITTPPGLYGLGFTIAQFLGSSLIALRSVNVIPLILWLQLSRKGPSSSSSSTALLACGFPLLAFYANLYYTDLWATILVLLALEIDCPTKSAILLFISLWFRQTNIIWTALVTAFQIFNKDLTVYDAISKPADVVSKLVRKAPPYVLVAASFAGFLKWNGSIALGDKTNHTVSLHLAQLGYFSLFFALFSAPLALLTVYEDGWRFIRRLLGKLYLVPIEVLVLYFIVKYGTITHPFILSDNRHYTFYIWRKIITPMNGYSIIPVYWASWRWFASTVNFKLVRTWIFIAATLLVLVPSPLMEPRYYILPYLIWRIHLYSSNATNIENIWNLAINCATVAIFCLSQTHFMW